MLLLMTLQTRELAPILNKDSVMHVTVLMCGSFINYFQYPEPEMVGSQENFHEHAEIT